MLESNPPVLSPSIPQSMEYYGLWEQETFPPPVKIESPDIMELIDSNVTTTIHHLGRDPPHPTSTTTSQYLPHLPPPPPSIEYNSTDNNSNNNPQQTFEYFVNEPSPSSSSFSKLSQVQNSTQFIENYDYFLPDLSQPHGGLVHWFPGGHPLMHSQISEPPSHSSSMSHPTSEYTYWDELHCDQDFLNQKTECCFPPELDSEELDSKSSTEIHSNSTESSFHAPQKRKVGRPPKKDKKLKQHEKKTGRLWEFIRDLLKNPDYCPSLVKWENAEEGLFRFVNSEKVAQLWGQIKGNPRMTYEKLSRAMRYYYKSHVFEPVLGRRLVYKFGCNATNWRPTNNNYMSSTVKLYSSTSSARNSSDRYPTSTIQTNHYFKEQN